MIAIIADGRWGKRVVDHLRDQILNGAITWGVRSTAFAKELMKEEKGVSISSYSEAIKANEVVMVAMPYVDLLPWTDVFAPILNGKIVIDLSVPQTSEDRHIFGWQTSCPEQLQKKLPGSRIVGAKSTSIYKLAGKEPDASSLVYITSDDEVARKRVVELFRSTTYSIVDAGELEENRAIDRMISLRVT
ncbi:NAD(P)-binding domain-containing protein [uncultured Brevibacillus sp.]|uniref:NAD(P)-binding domain-containing protein n=1 Tax=uncultured Brevibacillus sp. TaxID=169970 RepID=UPI0025923940|nr:NAD(P)-binding domain-containing protein [uncultured Brevibacillus sp.]